MRLWCVSSCCRLRQGAAGKRCGGKRKHHQFQIRTLRRKLLQRTMHHRLWLVPSPLLRVMLNRRRQTHLRRRRMHGLMKRPPTPPVLNPNRRIQEPKLARLLLIRGRRTRKMWLTPAHHKSRPSRRSRSIPTANPTRYPRSFLNTLNQSIPSLHIIAQ